MHREDILRHLQQHRTLYMDEASFVRKSIKYIQDNPDCFERAHGPLHITASAWVVNPARNQALLVHHGKLHQWFQPGGHADGDTDVLRVAMREATEESGVDESHIHLLSPEVFDVDMHWVPKTAVAPAHGHIDLRFLLEVDEQHDAPGNDESHEIRWVPLHEVLRYNSSRSTYRMLDKTRRFSQMG